MKYTITGKFPITREQMKEYIGSDHEFTTNFTQADVALVGDKPGNNKMLKIFKNKLKVMYEADVVETFGEIEVKVSIIGEVFYKEVNKKGKEDFGWLSYDSWDNVPSIWNTWYDNKMENIRIIDLSDNAHDLEDHKINVLSVFNTDEDVTYMVFTIEESTE